MRKTKAASRAQYGDFEEAASSILPSVLQTTTIEVRFFEDDPPLPPNTKLRLTSKRKRAGKTWFYFVDENGKRWRGVMGDVDFIFYPPKGYWPKGWK